MTKRQAPTWRKRGTGLPPKYGPAHTADPTASTLMGSRAYCGTWFPTGRDHLWANAGPDDRRCRECERGAQRTAEAITAGILRAAAAEVEHLATNPFGTAGQGGERIWKMLYAALHGPKDQWNALDDVTVAVHSAICETSPEDCAAWRGACVRAVEALRTEITGALPIPY